MIDPKLYNEIQQQLRSEFRTLRLSQQDGVAYVRGALPINGDDGSELARFQIEIKLQENFPESVPIVWETGGHVPRHLDRHVYADGSACLFVGDESWRFWNKKTSLIDFIKGPIYQYFLGQIYYEEHHTWPFGERSHSELGVAEYYFEELGTANLFVVYRFLELLAAKTIDTNSLCYCGSLRSLRNCHQWKLSDLRSKIPVHVAVESRENVKELLYQLSGKPVSIKLAYSIKLSPAHYTAERIRRRFTIPNCKSPATASLIEH